MQLQSLLETCLYVDDLDAAQHFYERCLGLQLVSRQGNRHVFFRCGNQMLLLFDPQESAQIEGDLPPHGAHGPGHVAFAASLDELAAWAAQLESAGVMIEKWIDWPQGGRSLYFRDPSGNSLEIATPQIWGSAAADVLQ